MVAGSQKRSKGERRSNGFGARHSVTSTCASVGNHRQAKKLHRRHHDERHHHEDRHGQLMTMLEDVDLLYLHHVRHPGVVVAAAVGSSREENDQLWTWWYSGCVCLPRGRRWNQWASVPNNPALSVPEVRSPFASWKKP